MSLFILILWVASFQQTIQQITIVSPPEIKALFQNIKIKYSSANFGYIPQGKLLIGQLVYNNTISDQMSKSIDRKILLTASNGQSFVQSALRAQQQNFIGIIIILQNNDVSDRIVINGEQQNVNIPVLFISQKIGSMMIKSFENYTSIQIRIEFPINIEDEVHYKIGISFQNPTSYKFLKEFKQFQERLGNRTHMSIVYQIYSCKICKIEALINIFDSNCLGGGQYCSQEINIANNSQIIQGKEVILEIVRQQCILSLRQNQWWDYMLAFQENCLIAPNNFSQCSKNIQNRIFDDSSFVDECVSEAFELTELFNLTNSDHLKKQSFILTQQLKQSSHFVFYPGVIINNVTYHGTLNAQNVFNDICSSLISPPDSCFSSEEIIIERSDEYLAVKVSIFIIINLVAFSLCLIFIYRKYARRQFIQQMAQGVVSQYVQFTE